MKGIPLIITFLCLQLVRASVNGRSVGVKNNSTAIHATLSSSEDCTLYTITSSDTCFTITSSTNTTWAQLLAWNPDLSKTCSNLQSLISICVSNPAGNYSMPTNMAGVTSIVTTTAAIPTPTVGGSNAVCGKWYFHVGDNDNCDYITETFGISLADFLFLNPEVYSNCTNLWAGYYYCAEPVGYISTYPGYLPTTSTSDFIETPTTPLPEGYGAQMMAKYKSTVSVIPRANGTRADCWTYVWNPATNGSGTDCWGFAWVYGITNEANITDTSVSSSATTTIGGITLSDSYRYPCTISPSLSYCVQLASPTPTSSTAQVTPTPRAAGEISNCTDWFAPESYDTCQGIINNYCLEPDEFYEWNPTIGTNCTGLVQGTYYCISIWPDGQRPPDPGSDSSSTTAITTGTTTTDGITTPSPIQTGMVTNCDKFYLVQPNDGCYAIATSYGISLADFYAWNPAVGSSCAYLGLGDYVCVGVLSSSVTTTSTTTQVTTGISTPSPIQTGMVTNCNKFYLVKANDECGTIAGEYGITLADFYAWNPAVGSSCLYLGLGDYVCVGVTA